MKAVLTTTNLEAGLRWRQINLDSGAVDVIHQVTGYPGLRFQTFQGFGGAFAQAAAHCSRQLPEIRRQAFFGRLFRPGRVGLYPGPGAHGQL